MSNKLPVQTYLETNSFQQLETEWGICARVSLGGHKFSLNYDQRFAKLGNLIVEQCRGLVLGLELGHGGAKVPTVGNGKPDPNFCPGKTVVYAYPMDKFYNSEEHHAAKIDWHDRNLLVEDKLDGTLCILYWDAVLSQWCVATRSVPDADVPIDGVPEHTFTTFFKVGLRQTTGMTFADFTAQLSKAFTYCFELTGPLNRIMVEYKEPGVTLLAIRDNHDHREQKRAPMMKVLPVLAKVPRPKTWALGSYEEIRAFVNDMSPTECEGAVVMDKDFNRIKIKSMKWLVANATKTTISASPRNLVKYILQGIDDDVQTMLPAGVQEQLEDMRHQIHQLFTATDALFLQWQAIATSRKHFAELVSLHTGWSGPYFKLYEGKFKTTWEFVQSLLKSDKLSDAFIDGILKHVKVRPNATCDQETVSG